MCAVDQPCALLTVPDPMAGTHICGPNRVGVVNHCSPLLAAFSTLLIREAGENAYG